LQEDGTSTKLEGFLLAGDISAEAWVKTLLQDELPTQAYGRLLLVPGAKAPLAVVSRGKQVCSCFDVSERQIETVFETATGSDAERLAAVQSQLRCGTNCGSCLPELNRMVHARSLPAH
ncbi:MAG: (2Fe-2S)-binding protein, partial [Pseudorhodobacter sp.]|nr:(2Fe-2S)-binding protein [Rhizobacter sp.]